MCGIAGIYRYNTAVTKTELKTMSDSLIHRGPDGEGQWVGKGGNIGLSHRRLSILDLSDNAAQPMLSKDKRYSITFNGEIYNYLEIKADLEEKGYHFSSQSDTEVILYAYQAYGENFLQHLDGMFAFAIWDELKKELFCARDRFGEKPFYYFNNNKQFVFASEMKALFALGVDKITDERMVFIYLAYDIVENPNNKAQTFYRNIYSLPASHSLKIKSNRKIEIKKYWDIDLSTTSSLSLEDASYRFQTLFDKSIKKRMRSDVPVGSSLSGGVDSSSILASVLSIYPQTQFNTFTARFSDLNYDEGAFVDKLEEKYQFNRINCYPKPNQIINDLERIFYHQEEPFGTSSIIAQWEVMKTAKQHNTTVLLDGQGADETLAGYFKYFLPFLYEIKNNNNYTNQKAAIEKHLSLPSFISKKEAVRMKIPWLFDKITDITRPYRRTVASDLTTEFRQNFKSDINPFHRDTDLNHFLYNDIYKYGLGKLLRFSDRNAMAHSVEVRLPYLSHYLVEFVFSLPASYKIDKAWTKYILRQSMENRVPKSILYRKDKKGFQAPKSWMENKEIQTLIYDSFILLKKEKITQTFDKQHSWKYLMLGQLLKK